MGFLAILKVWFHSRRCSWWGRFGRLWEGTRDSAHILPLTVVSCQLPPSLLQLRYPQLQYNSCWEWETPEYFKLINHFFRFLFLYFRRNGDATMEKTSDYSDRLDYTCLPFSLHVKSSARCSLQLPRHGQYPKSASKERTRVCSRTAQQQMILHRVCRRTKLICVIAPLPRPIFKTWQVDIWDGIGGYGARYCGQRILEIW